MKQRILTAVVGIPVVLLALFGPPILAEIFIALVGIGIILEYLRLVEHENPPQIALFVASLIILILLAIFLTGIQLAVVLAGLVLIAAATHWIGGIPLWNSFGLLYVTVPLALLVSLRLIEKEGQEWLILVLAATWVTDTMALFGGMTFGKRKLAPTISPKKTWEGTIIGVVSGMLAILLVGFLSGLLKDHPAAVILAALLLPPLAVIGDLVESKIKRVYDKKDSGTLLPGHGGLLDRVDSLFFTAMGLWVLVVLIA